MVLNPITSTKNRVVGVAGMILDERVFREEVVPKVIEKFLPKYFGKNHASRVHVVVRNAQGEAMVGEVPDHPGKPRRRRFTFAFADWSMALYYMGRTPEQLASTYFLINVSLSVLTAIVLLGGVILALRTASREMRLSQMKADFVSNVSHELRTPLASIRVFGEFLRLGRTRTAEKTREYGQYIEVESRRLTQLINNVLDFSRIESGRKTYNFDQLDLEEVVHETLECFEVRLAQSGFTIEFEAPGELVPSVRADRDALGQALSNLVENAVKYSGESREIKVGLEQENGHARLWVADHGIGISREEQQHIFERFHRVGSSLVHDVKGFGLGLSIVSHVVQAHGGGIDVESELGKGSRFTIRLPLSDASPEDASVSSESARREVTGQEV